MWYVSAERGDGMRMGLPFRMISPSSGWYRPYRIRISVVLPAPFSPNRQWISPLRTVKLTPSLAMTPGKRLTIPRSSITLLSVALRIAPFYVAVHDAFESIIVI